MDVKYDKTARYETTSSAKYMLPSEDNWPKKLVQNSLIYS